MIRHIMGVPIIRQKFCLDLANNEDTILWIDNRKFRHLRVVYSCHFRYDTLNIKSKYEFLQNFVRTKAV